MTPIRTADRLPTKEEASDSGDIWVFKLCWGWTRERYDMLEHNKHLFEYWLPYKSLLPENM